MVRSVIGAVLLAENPLSPYTIATILGFDIYDVLPLLSSAQSLLMLQDDINSPVQPFHKSFPDFIIDPDRCTNQRFHISPPHHHLQLLVSCLNLIDQLLERNMCKHACRSWHTHLTNTHATTSVDPLKITSTLHWFLENNFFSWLEVLSVLGAVKNAVHALQVAVDWLEVC